MHPLTGHHIQEDTDPRQHSCEDFEPCTWCQQFSKFLLLLDAANTPQIAVIVFFAINNISPTLLPSSVPTVKSLRPIPRLKQASGPHPPLVLKLFGTFNKMSSQKVKHIHKYKHISLPSNFSVTIYISVLPLQHEFLSLTH